MTFAVTTFCSPNIQKCTGEDGAFATLDFFLVASLVSVVCLTVIAKMDLGLGQVGTFSNKWMQALVGISGGIFVLDLVAFCLKNRPKALAKVEARAEQRAQAASAAPPQVSVRASALPQKSEEDRKQRQVQTAPQVGVSVSTTRVKEADAKQKTATVPKAVATPTAEELEAQSYVKLNDETSTLFTVGLFQPAKGRKLDIYRNLEAFTSPLEVYVSNSVLDTHVFEDGNQRVVTDVNVLHIETDQNDLMVPGKIVWSLTLDLKFDRQGALHVKYPDTIKKWQWQERARKLVEITLSEEDHLVERTKILMKFGEFEAR